VLEGASIGGGTTGTTTGKITALHRTVYQEIYSSHGEEGIRSYATLNQDGKERLAEWVAKYQIDCDWMQAPNYTYCLGEGKPVDMIKREHEMLQRAGIEDAVLGLGVENTPNDLPFKTQAWVKINNEYMCNAMALTRGLANALTSNFIDAYVYENSPVNDVSGLMTSPFTISTADGASIRADNVFVATGMPILDRSGHFACCKVLVSYCLAFEIDKEVLGDRPIISGMYINPHDDIDESLSIRIAHDVDGETLVVISSAGHEQGDPPKGCASRQYELAETIARKYIPYLGAVRYQWSACDFKAADGIPYIGHAMRGSKGLYVSTGYMKWGLAMAAGAASIIADLIDGREDNPLHKTFDARRWDLTSSLVDIVKGQLHVGKHFVGDRISDHMHVPDIEELRPGCGGVCRIKSHTLSAEERERASEIPSGQVPAPTSTPSRIVGGYRTMDGSLLAVDLNCTHLGCHVRWNDGDRSWDCPCHGSRFAPDGLVLHGPAAKPLPRYNPITGTELPVSSSSSGIQLSQPI
jgi:glycine/D-amino acid oxidase-like deaminating enzyme/nitrite reductase/ring-hydroxylating ferredoxin subunit